MNAFTMRPLWLWRMLRGTFSKALLHPMKPLFHPHLINDVFGDPGLYIEFLFEKRALLFDMGDLHALPPRKMLHISHVFVSHCHMDHFIGFDALLRICLGREKLLTLFGPPGFIQQIEHKLGGYTWNLVHKYSTNFTIIACEVQNDLLQRARFRCQTAFYREKEASLSIHDGVLLDEANFCIRTATLDHSIPSLAFALEEKSHLNVWKTELAKLGIPVGPWIKELKIALLRGDSLDRLITISWQADRQHHKKVMPLGELAHIIKRSAGQKITYVVDTAFHAANAERIIALAKNSDVLFIEATFLEQDIQHAQMKHHLTATQAGRLAQRAGVKCLVTFHYSPKYKDCKDKLEQEAQREFLAGNEEG